MDFLYMKRLKNSFFVVGIFTISFVSANEFSDLVDTVLAAISNTAVIFDTSQKTYEAINSKLDDLMPGFKKREEEHNKVFKCIKEDYGIFISKISVCDDECKVIETDGKADIVALKSKLSALKKSTKKEIDKLKQEKDDLDKQVANLLKIYKEKVGENEQEAERLVEGMVGVSNSYDKLIKERDLFIAKLDGYIAAIDQEDKRMQVLLKDLSNNVC